MKKINILLIFLIGINFLKAQNVAFQESNTSYFSFINNDTIKSADPMTKVEKLEQVEESVIQNNSKKKKADKLHQDLGYMKSVDLYQEIQANKQVTTPSMMVNLADAYRLNGETEAAEYWYARYIRSAKKSEDYLHYAQVLQSNGKCEDAIRWYEKYQSEKGAIKMNFIENCDELEAFPANEGMTIKNVSSLNSTHLDFSPVPYKNSLVFTSSRGTDAMIVHQDNWTKNDFTDLFIADRVGEDEFEAVRPLSSQTNKKFHDGTATFSPDGATMIFTRNHQKGKSSKNVINLQLLAAKNNRGDWTEVRPLPFNSKEWNTCHPTLSADGLRLYFASDRPGGFGGMDIYVSKSVDGEWQEPTVLGPEVNSAGNELFPYMDKNDVLYFASNGHKGIGGLDIFKVTQSATGNENTWSNRQNMGHHINSPKDDFGFIKNEDRQTGWLTSNRLGGKGSDDIYYWDKNGVEEKPLVKMICIQDAQTGQRLSNAIVNIIKTPYSASFEENWQTDRTGAFAFPIKEGESYGMTVNKEGYLEESVALSVTDLMETVEYCIELNKPAGVLMQGKVLIAAYESLLPNATVTLFNHCTNEKQQLVTDELGAFEVRLDCNCTYDLTAEKAPFSPTRQVLNFKQMDCETGQNLQQVLKLSLATTPIPTVSTVPTLELKEPLTVGAIIRLDDLYYDYNEAFIRSDAAMELDKVVNLMKEYPSMEIEMRSHTDARGPKTYNEELSDRRAKSAMKYLVNRGISRSRLSAKGYGESVLTNTCKDGVKCREEQHQENRRTEIKVTRL